MSNVKSIITSHNTRIIRKIQPQDISAEICNCRNKHACPLQNKCMSKDIVYKATISTGNTQDTKHYIGMTSNTFKERYRNHIKSFTHKKYSNETELSKHVWHLMTLPVTIHRDRDILSSISICTSMKSSTVTVVTCILHDTIFSKHFWGKHFSLDKSR